MKKTIILATLFAILHHAIGLGVNYVASLDIMLPTTLINIVYMVAWGVLSYWLYQKDIPIKQHLVTMLVPVIVLFGLFVPIANVLQISLIVLYFAPAFAFASSVVYMLSSYATWKVIAVSIVLMLLAAWLGAVVKTTETEKE